VSLNAFNFIKYFLVKPYSQTLDSPKQLFRYKHAILFGYSICWMLKREFKSVYTFVISSLVYAFTRKHKTRLKSLKLSLTVTIILSKLLFQSKFKNLQSILPRLNNCRYFIQTVIWENFLREIFKKVVQL